MSFEPIAIVGQACLLPGASSPDTLWEAVVARRDLTGSAPPDRWGVLRRDVRNTPGASADRTWSDRGGYVRDAPAGGATGDPLFDWLLHVAREALRDAGLLTEGAASAALMRSDLAPRAGAVVGNLSFPSYAMASHAARVWLGDELADAADVPRVHPRSRFGSGLPALAMAEALGLGAGAFCLDAACASSLVAIKLACDRLHARAADVMLAGAVSCADDLFIHIGFCALQAMSKSGQSRPFHRDADGLVPAEGAGLVVLERLTDAERSGRPILGVIRGLGLSNDGRGKGMLAPSRAGQVRAMARAYAESGLSPSDIDYVECHATGTPAGDATELSSMAQVFAGPRAVPIGSLKSNLGHLITAAGVAGVIKVLAAMKHGTLPPTLHVDAGSALPALAETPFRVVTEPEPWLERSGAPRRAALSAFGFGGNNAHLLLEAYEPGSRASAPRRAGEDGVVIVAVVQRLSDGETLTLDAQRLRFPPNDLAEALPQQLLMLAAADEALAAVGPLPGENTGVFIGMGCDASVARYGGRWRIAQWARRWGAHDDTWLGQARAAFMPELTAAGVLGTMPNLVANRINSAFDLGGSSMTVSGEELSGVYALEAAWRALQLGELDVALVGAVDVSREPAHAAALEALGLAREHHDAAVALVLMREPDARARSLPALAVLDGVRLARTNGAEPIGGPGAHAAMGLWAVADAVRSGGVVELASALGGAVTVTLTAGTRAAVHASRPEGGLPFRACLPPIELPPFPERFVASAQPAPAVEATMPRAPTLARITPAEVSLPISAPPPAPGRRSPVSVALSSMPGAAMTQLAEQRAQLARQHRQFLTQQAHVHERFLGQRARTQDTLLAMIQANAVWEPRGPALPPPTLPPPPPRPAGALPGFTLDRAGLMVHAGGKISDVFGPELAAQDAYTRQVRMPLPPLLLADRMVGIDARIGSMGLGTIWTETDVTPGAWYLHQGRMPAGIMIEAGQADLMLISYLGVDLLNRSERVYRLLGCELTYHGSLPEVGDTLRYDIHIDGHASQGDIRLFFFHYDCHIGGAPRLSVRHGQAGFFTDEELAGSAGVLWDATTATPCAAPRLEAGPCVTERRRFDRGQLEALAAGRPYDCFGAGFEPTGAHTDSPAIAGGRMLLLDEVTDFDPHGGPWGRGYLRAIDTITPEDWFFTGHFHNDPCMPGTLMFEGCLQTMAFYLAAQGFTIDRDAWRFEPVPEETFKLRCRGQVLPTSRDLVYEVFVEELVGGPHPTLYADLLCTIDGRKAFHCQRMALRLVPDWPLERLLRARPELLSTREGATSVDGFAFDHHSLLACAWGRPSAAFGPMYARFDSHRRVARLPGPPYHFMTRVTAIDGTLGRLEKGQHVVVEYDIPPGAWYFDDNGFATMPYCVLLEAALQPCGWLASFVGSALGSETDLVFRNLDGTGTLKAELPRDAGTLVTRARIVNISASAGMVIESFEVTCELAGEVIYEMTTVFGFFPKEALEAQVGLPVPAEDRDALVRASDVHLDLRAQPARYFAGTARLPSLKLLMIDRITGIWADESGVRYRSEQDVDPNAWYLKAHFFQDPVQPGSLGIEAMLQLLQFAMLEQGLDAGLESPRFEPLALDRALTWKYRGQVSVRSRKVHCLVDVLEKGRDERGVFAIARASLWCDGLRIYEAKNLGMRLVEGRADEGDTLLDPAVDTWLGDHRPTFTVPALPLMSMVDRLAAAALATNPERHVVAIDDVSVARWLPLPGPVRVRTEVTPAADGRLRCTLLAWRDASRTELSRFEPVAHATVTLAGAYPEPPPAPAPLDAPRTEDPYASGALFHGPAFHLLEELRLGSTGSSAVLEATSSIPRGALHQGLFDAATHAIPHDALHRWSEAIAPDEVAYPYRLDDVRLYAPAPDAGPVRCEVRFVGLEDRFPVMRVTLIAGERVFAELSLTEILLPKGPLGSAPPTDRRAFLRDRAFVPGLSLSRRDGEATRLCEAEVRASNWLPGTLEALYRGPATPGAIAVKEHIAALLEVHPCHVDPTACVAATHPLTAWPLAVTADGGEVVVCSAGEPRLELRPVVAYWDRYFGIGRWPVEDVYYGLIQRFVRRVHVTAPDGFAELRGRSVLYLANHQVAVESLLFSIIVAALSETPTVTLAKIEHRHTWLGKLIQHCFSYPGITDPRVITYFDRSDPSSLASIIGELSRDMSADGKSVMVHVEGTRSLTCRTPVQKMTSAFIDLALATRSPIVPVRFVGALPAAPLATRLEFPVGMGRQDVYLGAPIHPATFEATPYKERKELVIAAINALGPPNASEEPFAGDPAFDAAVRGYQAEAGVSHEHATLHELLRGRDNASEATTALLAGHEPADTPEGRWLAELALRLRGPAR